ncbi:MAG: WD40 repeat domain-containing protein [Okeania sp. SIO3I5]|uniref:WD40 repeat domain-containing protein n=1 Tax=Okeania sp. SIO3I5 TaxID=2607805 RepID=UPI0013B798F2|nr:WD40 repeat domain-containing protein [Okeania sp. SIO3I5]NEQ38471.1 WD40 repeat domain-containing protein [Okeania sp. SIO3I5]
MNLKFPPPKLIFILVILIFIVVPIRILNSNLEKCNHQNYTLPKYVYFKDFDFGFSLSSVVINNSNKTVIVAGNSSEIRILDLDGEKDYPPLQTEFNGFRSLALNEKVGYLVGGTLDGSVVLWQSDKSSKNGWSEDYIIFPQKQSQSISSVAISRSGKLIASSSDDTILIWRNSEGGNKWELRNKIFSGHSGRQVFDLVFGNDDQTLFTVGNDNLIKIWNLGAQGTMNNGNEVDSYNNYFPIISLVFRTDNNELIFGTNNGKIKAWNVQVKPEIADEFIREHDSQPVNTLAISEAEKLLVSGSNDNTIKLWDLCTKENFQTLSKHTEWVRSVDISLDKIYIVSGGLDKKIIIWKREKQ